MASAVLGLELQSRGGTAAQVTFLAQLSLAHHSTPFDPAAYTNQMNKNEATTSVQFISFILLHLFIFEKIVKNKGCGRSLDDK